MRYPIKEGTGKPYGMPKGEKADQVKEPDLEEVNKQRLAAAAIDVTQMTESLKPTPKHEPVKEKGKK